MDHSCFYFQTETLHHQYGTFPPKIGQFWGLERFQSYLAFPATQNDDNDLGSNFMVSSHQFQSKLEVMKYVNYNIPYKNEIVGYQIIACAHDIMGFSKHPCNAYFSYQHYDNKLIKVVS